MRGPLNLAGGHDLLPRGTIGIAPARELTALGAIGVAYEADGTVAVDTLKRPLLEIGLGPTPERLPETPTATCEDETVWGGEMVNQFGHFLIESVTRLWPMIEGGPLAGRTAVFKARQPVPVVSEWLAAFGLRTMFLPAEGAVRFERMHVPEQSWRLGAWIAPELRYTHLHARRGMELPTVARRDVLWLSRSQLGPGRVPYDEALLEWVLRDRVSPVHPETMTLAEQVATLEGCRAVAGTMGSAFHGLLLTEDTPDAVYICAEFAKGPYSAQHRVLEGTATFAQAAVPVARLRRLRREGFLFPGGHRIEIPEALQSLQATILPDLFEDPRMAAFAEPGRASRKGALDEIDSAAIATMREPLSAAPRRRLAALLDEQGLNRCAAEQLRIVAELAELG